VTQAVYLTEEGQKSIRAELEHMIKVDRPRVADRLSEAKQLGDLSENAEYEDARAEQSFLEGRIQMLESQLRHAVLIEPSDGDIVELGSSVKIRDDEGEEGTYTVVGMAEASPKAGRISNVSPVGRALMGGKAGDVVVARTPSGELNYTILAVGAKAAKAKKKKS